MTLYSSKEDFIAGDETGAPKFIKKEDQSTDEFTLSNWIQIEDNNLVLQPNETKEVYFRLNVPNNAEPGWHYAAIFFSQWTPGNTQVAVVQRMWVLLLVNVEWTVNINANLKKFDIQNHSEKLPITIHTTIENTGNVHIKPKGKIEIIDEEWNVLKNIGKESLLSPNGAFIGEKLVDYINLNEVDGNVLPKSQRKYENKWEWFGYTKIDENGTKKVDFYSIEDYYKNEATKSNTYVKFWQEVKQREVKKKFQAKLSMSYEWKDKVSKDFSDSKDFFVTYNETYIGYNFTALGFLLILILGWGYYFIIISPNRKKQAEENLRKKIIEEMQQK